MMKNIKWKYILYILNMIFYQHCYYDFGCMACDNGVSFLIFESFFAACLGFPTGHFGCSSGWKKSLTNTRIGIIFHETDHLGHELRRMEKVFSWPYRMLYGDAVNGHGHQGIMCCLFTIFWRCHWKEKGMPINSSRGTKILNIYISDMPILRWQSDKLSSSNRLYKKSCII